MDKTRLLNYAKLIATCGVNIQKGQEVIINCDTDQIPFIQMLVEQCYIAGASKVTVEFSNQEITKLNYKYRSLEVLSTVEKWETERLKHYVKTIPCRIYIESEDPDGLRDADQEKIAKSRQAVYPKIKKYRDMIENKYQWCIAAVPGPKWAKKLFPGDSQASALEKLWKAILETSRAYCNPIAEWEKHNKEIHKRCDYLNKLKIESLHYTASNGTDLTIGLIEQGKFCGASEKTLCGVEFNPNIPSEECFTTPMKGKAEGIVFSTKPLSFQGQLIENFWIRFKDGKAVEHGAEKNDSLLEKIITMDKGSAYIGECALVPYDSPISNSGILFYNTLFDENAACHLALGMGFADCIQDYDTKTLKECRDLGVNDSMIHVDFMIGCNDLSIVATCKNGKKIKIFKDGNWAF